MVSCCCSPQLPWLQVLCGHLEFRRKLNIVPRKGHGHALEQGCQTHFHPGPHQPRGCPQRAKCNFNSLTVKEQLHLYSLKITFGPLKVTSRLEQAHPDILSFGGFISFLPVRILGEVFSRIYISFPGVFSIC